MLLWTLHPIFLPSFHHPLQDLSEQLGGATLAPEQVAGSVVGQRAWVKWPYLQEALVEAVSDCRGKVRTLRVLWATLALDVWVAQGRACGRARFLNFSWK